MAQLFWVALVAGPLMARPGNTGPDPIQRFAWGENIGWVNAMVTNHDMTIHFDGNVGWLSGYAWAENVGWILMGGPTDGPYANTTSNNWGVNLAPNGDFGGYAWGENIGWINFEGEQCNVTVNRGTGEFSGYAWGENIGWLKFSRSIPNYGMRTMAFDKQPHGTPNWWLRHHKVTETSDAGDGVAAWKKYVMDADPNVVGDYLRITAISNAPGGRDVTFAPVSERRHYKLKRTEDLQTGEWTDVKGQASVGRGSAGKKTLQDTNSSACVFYSVEVSVDP